jgi:adenine-specific DNA-methyltransferase
MAKQPKAPKTVAALKHDEARRRNIPTAELQATAEWQEEARPVAPVVYQRATPLPKGTSRDRDEDLDPQLVWRGKDRQDWSDLVVQAPPLYIQEKVHPKAIIDDLVRRSKQSAQASSDAPDLFGDFNGLDPGAKTEFYQHYQNWSNRMILGDSLYVMASLATREGLKGKVQCIYIDPPYGIKFNSNWQVSTVSRDVKDGKREDISREPEQVKAFRDTWKDGIHSYLTYLRDRLTVAKELLTESGSIFVQIGDENVHRVRAVMDEVFGDENFVAQIAFLKTASATSVYLSGALDYIFWFARAFDHLKYRPPLRPKTFGGDGAQKYSRIRLADLSTRPISADEREDPSTLPEGGRVYRQDNLTSQSIGREKGEGAASWFPVSIGGRTIRPNERVRWKTNQSSLGRLLKANRIELTGNSIAYVRFLDDFSAYELPNYWDDIGGIQSRSDPKIYVVQTAVSAVQRCILMTTDPGDLVLDPTCGSGTTAYVAEQWGRRWITIDTSRVALALARARIMGARYPYYFLAYTSDGRRKEAEVTRKPPSDAPTHGDLRHGFVYERAPHVTLKSIANNAEIDVIWEEFQTKLEPLRADLNTALGKSWEEWEIPREVDAAWSDKAKQTHAAWWELRIARQKEIDDSIARNAEVELLYDRPYEDKSKVRVAGPFTVESLSPHRVVPADEDELADNVKGVDGRRRRMRFTRPPTDFAEMVLEHLMTSGIQQSAKQDAIRFTSLQPSPGEYIGAEGTFLEGDVQRRGAIFFGPEFGTVSRQDLVAAAREATETRFDVLVACAFNFDAHASELTRLGPLPILRAKMNPDLHMAGT